MIDQPQFLALVAEGLKARGITGAVEGHPTPGAVGVTFTRADGVDITCGGQVTDRRGIEDIARVVITRIAAWNATFDAPKSKAMAEAAVAMMTQQELLALCALAMTADPWPEHVDQVKVFAALNRFSRQMGAADGWIEAHHRIPLL